MDKDAKPLVKKPDVLRKLNAQNLHLIERGLLGDIPDRFKANVVPTRGQSNELIVAKPTGLLSSCLPVSPSSPEPYKDNSLSLRQDDGGSPLKKSFSFRDKFRIGFFQKDKIERPEWKTIVEDETTRDPSPGMPPVNLRPEEQEVKSSKRFWFFRNKELMEKKDKYHKPIYKRSKSFEFLPKALEEQPEEKEKPKLKKNSLSYAYGSGDTITASSSVESLEYIADVYYNKVNGVCLKSIKELHDSDHNSGLSTSTSASSGIVVNIFKTESVQNLLDEFDKAVDMFSENYLSDSEPYTKTWTNLTNEEKRRSSSFNTLPSPKIMQVTRNSMRNEEFKAELTKMMEIKRATMSPSSARRGSVTDWFVLEENAATDKQIREQNKYRRSQQKPTQRVRRISSTKFWITPEECEVYSRERRPPLVIPRITQYRPPRNTRPPIPYVEEEPLQDVPAKSWNWASSSSERSRLDLDRSFSRTNGDNSMWASKRLGGSTENLLIPRRPTHLLLPPSSSGDSLDVEVRDRDCHKQRNAKSLVMTKHKPRTTLHAPIEATVLFKDPIKRTKFFEGGKKVRKNWTECYVMLTPTALVFFKDQRTYIASRSSGSPPSPGGARAELVLPLRNAHVLPCKQMHTRRYVRSLVVSVEHDQYLLQHESEDGARRLLAAMHDAIYTLGPPTEERPSPYQSSSTDLESLGRTPPVARHARKQKAGGSSNEDLSDSTEVSKSHVRSRLKKFFAKRPAMEVLVKKGIYKDLLRKLFVIHSMKPPHCFRDTKASKSVFSYRPTLGLWYHGNGVQQQPGFTSAYNYWYLRDPVKYEPVFGRRLEEVCPPAPPRVPEFVRVCVRAIESSDENMATDGLYRASGNLSQVQKIRLEIDQNNLSVIENSPDIHVLTGSLKLFFRELKEPLIPCFVFDRVLAACSIRPRDARIKEFREIVQSLPPCNRDTLKFLLEHLLKVTQYSERNRMHTANLAIVFGPTLLWAPPAQAHNIAFDCIQQNNVVDVLLSDYTDIFSDKRH